MSKGYSSFKIRTHCGTSSTSIIMISFTKVVPYFLHAAPSESGGLHLSLHEVQVDGNTGRLQLLLLVIHAWTHCGTGDRGGGCSAR